MNILVTGAGALLGQGILRCLKLTNSNDNIITADPSPTSSGHWLGNKSYLIPLALSPDYMPAIEKIIKEENIAIVFIGTDVELPIFAKHKEELEKKYNTHIVVASSAIVDIANDKWLTTEFLRKNNFPYPHSALTSDRAGVQKIIAERGFPVIVKPVDGARSIGFEVIKDQERLEVFLSTPNNFVVQERLSDDEGEYTSGCVVYNGECKAIVTLKRDLRDGNTFRTYRDKETSKYDETIRQMAGRLNIEGPCNFQFRIKNGQPVIFEINSRFSGTTPLRCFYGFNEVEAILGYIFDKKDITQPVLKEGVVMRVFSDIMITNEDLSTFKVNGVFDHPASEQFNFIP